MNIKNAIGIDDNTTSSNAGAAALAKNASEEVDQTSVAKVLKPKGPKISDAGNSFIVTRKTSIPPAIKALLTKGIVTNLKDANSVLPNTREDSTTAGYF